MSLFFKGSEGKLDCLLLIFLLRYWVSLFLHFFLGWFGFIGYMVKFAKLK